MSNLTPEQQLAVDKSNTNIIVSAGAGSGKTTVLKTRVLRELKNGVNVNNLIILTFTNNAAAEMKERIRKIINENDAVKEQALYLDSAYITTFDSFAQSLVKKYNYLLNMSKDFKIVDSSIISLEINRIIDDIFESLYKVRDGGFTNLINNFEIKDDKKIRSAIKKYYNSLSNLINKEDFLDSYIDKYYSDNYIDNCFNKYEEMIFRLVSKYINLLEELEDYTLNDKASISNSKLKEDLINSTSYDELLLLKPFAVPNHKGWYDEDGKPILEKLKKLREDLNSYTNEEKNILINHYKSTKDNVETIIMILKELDRRMIQFKDSHNNYEFSDIALKAIELVRDHDEVREEIKNSTFEIMIDEYQDTNDIQEEFISYIQNNNVYMVGDIKQSIYRFRNANPNIFKNKYDNYAENKNGFKIDLNKNFRSRDEVVKNVNLIFDNIMYDDVGGADYVHQHRMVYGNEDYLKYRHDYYDMEILTYNNENNEYKNEEIEAFIIAKDIKKRIEAKEQVTYLDNNVMKERDIDYQDFCVLVDKSKHFELLKKVLEYFNIPTMIYKDVSIKDDDEIYILKNLINLVIKVKELDNKRKDNDFIHYYVSIARSYCMNMKDEEIYEIVRNKSYEDTLLYQKIKNIVNRIDGLSNKEILNTIIEEFNIIDKLYLVGDIDERLTKLEYFINNATNLNNFGMDIYDLSDYFDDILANDDNDIKMSTNKDTSSNSVRIMTIHGSKGLEYPYVYLPYLNNNFTKKPDNSKFKYSSEFGFVIPFYDNGVGKTFLDDVNKYYDNIEELSERIRLFYVAMTRAKEKLIIINEFNQDIEALPQVTSHDLIDVKSYRDILSLIKNKISKYIINVNLKDLEINDNYKLIKDSNYKLKINNNTTKINIKSVHLDNKLLENKHFSKSLSKIIDKEFQDKLSFGTYMHYIFEVYSFQNDNLDELNIDDTYKNKIKNFLSHDEVKNISTAKTYKEYEIMFNKDGAKYHGFIDLLVEYEDHFDIIDYKLSNVNSPEYVIQLSGYKDYIENKFKKPCNIYLYSINHDFFKKI